MVVRIFKFLLPAVGCALLFATGVALGQSDTLRFRAATQADLEKLGLRTAGALIVEAVPKELGASLKPGDILAMAGPKPVTKLADLAAAVDAAKGAPVDVIFYRDGLPDSLSLKLTAAMLPRGETPIQTSGEKEVGGNQSGKSGKGTNSSDTARRTAEPSDLAGDWTSAYGVVTFHVQEAAKNEIEVSFSGFWIQDQDKKGLIKEGTFHLGTRKVAFSYYQKWNDQSGKAELTLSDDGSALSGSWTQPSGSGTWVMERSKTSQADVERIR